MRKTKRNIPRSAKPTFIAMVVVLVAVILAVIVLKVSVSIWGYKPGSSIAAAIIVFGGGLISLLFGLTRWTHAKESMSWPQVVGTIMYTRVSKVLVPDESSPPLTYDLVVRYTYEINGRRYEGNKLGLFDRDRRKSYLLEAEELADLFHKDAKVAVYYNPKQPEQAVLLPGLQTVSRKVYRRYIVLGVLAFPVGLAITYSNLTS